MINQKVLVLTGVLVLGAAAALLVGKGEAPKDARLGQPVLKATEAAAIDRVDVKKGPTGVTLIKGEGGVWHLGDAQGFPVDVTKLVRLIDELGRTTYERVAVTSQAEMDGVGMATATVVAMTGGGKDVLALRLGDVRKGGGQFVALGSEPKAYLVGQSVSASPDADQWEMKTLLNVDKDLVKEVSFLPAPASGKKAATVTRAKKEEPLKADQILSQVSFTKRYDLGNEEAKAALAAPNQATITLFDGRRYDAEVGSIGDKTKKYFLRLKADKGTGAVGEKEQKDLEALNALFAHYAFEVSAYIAQRFEPSPQA